MQVQVELKTARQEIKKLHRAKLQPLRSRRHVRCMTTSSPLMNHLDRQLYSDMIFPLIAAADGDKARLLPQVCTSWREYFTFTKANWECFAVTQPISDFSKLCHMLDGARRLRSLSLVCDEGVPIRAPHALCTLLQRLSHLESLSLIALGGALTSTSAALLPTSVTDLRIEAAPELDRNLAQVLAARLPRLRSLQLIDTCNLNDDGIEPSLPSLLSCTKLAVHGIEPSLPSLLS
jgi:hypothetical protein